MATEYVQKTICTGGSEKHDKLVNEFIKELREKGIESFSVTHLPAFFVSPNRWVESAFVFTTVITTEAAKG